MCHKHHKSYDIFNVNYLTADRYMTHSSFEVEMCQIFPH